MSCSTKTHKDAAQLAVWLEFILLWTRGAMNPKNQSWQGTSEYLRQPPPPPWPPAGRRGQPVPPPPPPGPPPEDDPHRPTQILIPLELQLTARPRGCDADYIWHRNYGLLDKYDLRRPLATEQLDTLRLGYAEFNYDLQSRNRGFWLMSIVLMRWSAWFWKWVQWQDVAHLAAVCRQFRRTRLVGMMKSHTFSASRYWNRLEQMNRCRQSCSVMERIMWYHGVRQTGDCSSVLQRIGEQYSVGHAGGDLAIVYQIQ